MQMYGRPCFGSFNTQPPEGGWVQTSGEPPAPIMFQHTAARRRLAETVEAVEPAEAVSTHSRPKAAGKIGASSRWRSEVSTHSRPKAAGISLAEAREKRKVSTHSRPKAAG